MLSPRITKAILPFVAVAAFGGNVIALTAIANAKPRASIPFTVSFNDGTGSRCDDYELDANAHRDVIGDVLGAMAVQVQRNGCVNVTIVEGGK